MIGLGCKGARGSLGRKAGDARPVEFYDSVSCAISQVTRTRRSMLAGPTQWSPSVGIVLHDSHDLLPEIINHLAAMEGVRALPRIAAVCKHWQRVAVPLASSWAMLKYAEPAFPLVADKPTKASFVCSMPTAQARGRAPGEQDHSSLVVASVGKDIRILCPRSGVALAEIQTAPGVWPSGLACDGRHLFAAGSLDCTLYKLEITEASMEIVSGRHSRLGATHLQIG